MFSIDKSIVGNILITALGHKKANYTIVTENRILLEGYL
jgi:hypothetical protein